MNLNNLFKKQAKLDAYIIAKKGLEGQDLLPNTILALLVELGECANEWRGFKHWSEDKEPRTEKLLVEYVDCLHFILSIGNTLDVPKDHPYSTYDDDGDIVDQFQTCFNDISAFMMDGLLINDYYHFLELIRDFGSLGLMLGFTWEQIEAAYNAKWEINKQRQENGY